MLSSRFTAHDPKLKMSSLEFLLRLGEKMLTIVTRIWRGLFAYQIIIVAQRR